MVSAYALAYFFHGIWHFWLLKLSLVSGTQPFIVVFLFLFCFTFLVFFPQVPSLVPFLLPAPGNKCWYFLEFYPDIYSQFNSFLKRLNSLLQLAPIYADELYICLSVHSSVYPSIHIYIYIYISSSDSSHFKLPTCHHSFI